MEDSLLGEVSSEDSIQVLNEAFWFQKIFLTSVTFFSQRKEMTLMSV